MALDGRFDFCRFLFDFSILLVAQENAKIYLVCDRISKIT